MPVRFPIRHRFTRLERWLGIERLCGDVDLPPGYRRPKGKLAKSTKDRIYREQEGLCYLCREPMTVQAEGLEACRSDATWDHLHPLALGGKNTLANMALAHSSCNMIKGQLPCVDLTTDGGRRKALEFHEFIAALHSCQPLRKIL
jgi:5-methylcytosine-specific restriction endonuclease McrA